MSKGLSERCKYFILSGIAIAISVLWIIGAAILDRPSDGGRGGAIGVALSFYILFANNNLAARGYNRLKNAPVKEQIEMIESRFDVADKATRRQNQFLIWSSVIGTIAWGFGDWAATGLRLL
jgi:hypothetical protein